MTKQHFEAFARDIKLSDESEETRRAMARLVADVARQFNGRFDRDRFFRACGLD